MPTWDELDSVSWDVLYTYDDPLRDYRLNVAYGLGTVTREGPTVAVDWSGGGFIIDTLDAPFAKDRFDRGSAFADTQLVTNTGFETNTATWTGVGGTLAQSSTWKKSGSFSARLTPDGISVDNIILNDEIQIVAGRWYKVEGWLLSTNGVTTAGVSVNWYDAAHAFLSFSSQLASLTANVERQWSYYAQAPVNAAYARVHPIQTGTQPAGNLFYADDVKFTGAPVGSIGWTSTSFGDPWTTTGSVFSVSDTEGWISSTTRNSMRSAILAGVVNNDYDVMAKIRVPSFALTDKISVYLFVRYQDANSHWRYRFDFNIDQIIGWGVEQVVGGVVTEIWAGLVPLTTHTITDWYWVRAQGNGSNIRHKLWKDGVAQPDDPLILGITDTTYNGFPGAIGLGVVVASANTTTLPVNVEVGQFWAGANELLDNGNSSVIKSLDDGMPQGATDTTNLGIGEASAALTSPIGSRASVYWSTFRNDQPYSDIDRDVPGVAISSGAVTSDGVRNVRMFTGQMADVVVTDEDVTMKAVSRNRLRMSVPVQPPAVHGYYEGGEATWAIGYALFKAGLYVAPPPIPGCRFYQPMSGTLHVYIPDTNNKPFMCSMVVYQSPSLQVFGIPSFVDGPFPGTAAPDVRLDTTAARRVDGYVPNTSLAPGDDFWSQTAAQGRIEYWIRGDPVDVAGSMNPTESVVGRLIMFNPSVSRYIQLGVGTATRYPSLSISDGTNSLLATHTTPLPTDGKWHFLAASWDLPNNSLCLAIDGVTRSYLAAPLSQAALPVTDDIQPPAVSSNVPIAEVRVTSGPLASNKHSAWVRDIPWSPDVVMRRSFLTTPGIAEPAPVEAYALISRYAQAELARTGFDDQDRFQYLPLSYFGEAAQQLVVESLSTTTNLGRDFKPVREVNRTYNFVTVKYKQTEVQEVFVKVYESSNLIALNPGTTVLELATNKPAVEVRNSNAPFTVLDGSTLAASPPSDSNAINYITANTSIDGSGTYATSANLIVTITAWDPGSVTLSILNISGSILYVSNNVNLPALGVAAKALTAVDATVTAQNNASIVQRGPRLLEADMPAITNNIDALRVANELVARLGFPRTTFTSTAFGDPRRNPTQLVNVSDPDKTNLSGTFRITGVSNTQRQEDLDQRISGEQAWPVFVWGVSNWGEAVWGED